METKTLEQEALHLPEKERARLVVRLLESLDDVSDQSAAQLWAEEAKRRAEEIDRDEVDLVSEDALEEQVKAILK